MFRAHELTSDFARFVSGAYDRNIDLGSERRRISAGNAFTIAGTPIAENSAVIESGLGLSLSPDATFGLFYSDQIASMRGSAWTARGQNIG